MKKTILLVGAYLIIFCFSGMCEGKEITIKKGISKIIKTENILKVEVVNEAIVGATILSDNEIIVEGKKVGSTALTLTTAKGTEAYVITVKNQSNVDVMVEIDVQILEIIRTDNWEVGIDWGTLLGKGEADKVTGVISLLNAKEQAPPLLGFGQFSRGAVNVLVDFLVQKNYAKVLAKPKLLAASGKRAEFLAGGEIPVVFNDKNGNPKIDWKKYGVSLNIEPEVDKEMNIKTTLKAEVSNLDYGNAVKISGTSVIPAIKTRAAETSIVVAPESTIVIAGLIQNEESKITAGVPLLSEIPVLGELFKSTRIDNKKTELVIFVTPRIAGSESEL